MGSSEASQTSVGDSERQSSTREPADPKLELRECARRLNGRLGPTLVSALAGSTDPQHARAWAAGAAAPSPEVAQRLCAAYTAWCKVSEAEGERVARAWFAGANPWLDDDSPVNALRQDHFDAIARAADAIVEDSFSG